MGKLKLNWLCLRSQSQDQTPQLFSPCSFLLSPPVRPLCEPAPGKALSKCFSPPAHTRCDAVGLVNNQVLFLQVQSSPLSGRPPKQPCTGGSPSSPTCGRLESYSQSWSPKEECPTQVSAGPSRNGPLIGCSFNSIWGNLTQFAF